jgi:hypothetical protein
MFSICEFDNGAKSQVWILLWMEWSKQQRQITLSIVTSQSILHYVLLWRQIVGAPECTSRYSPDLVVIHPICWWTSHVVFYRKQYFRPMGLRITIDYIIINNQSINILWCVFEILYIQYLVMYTRNLEMHIQHLVMYIL